MRIEIKGTDLDLTPSIKTFIEDRMGSLAKLVRRFDREGVAEMRIEIARTTKHHKSGPVFRAEANLRLPKKILRASHIDLDIRTALVKLKEKLHLEIEKYRTKMEERPVRQARQTRANRKTIL